jgi:hypothetical protein
MRPPTSTLSDGSTLLPTQRLASEIMGDGDIPRPEVSFRREELVTCIADHCRKGTSYTCYACSGQVCSDHTSRDRYSGRTYCPAHAAVRYGQQAGIVFAEAPVGELVGAGGPPLDEPTAPEELELLERGAGVIYAVRSGEVVVPSECSPHVDYWSEVMAPALDWAGEQSGLLGFVVRTAREAERLDDRLGSVALGLASWAVDVPSPGSWPIEGSGADLFARAELPREMVVMLRDFPRTR